jgi:hemerythrin
MYSSIQLGDPGLDEEHERIHRSILLLRDASADVAAATLASLRVDAGAHFAAEDEDLRFMKDANASCHIDEHAAVLRSLDEVTQMLDDSCVPAEFKAQLVQRLARELLRWLPAHVNEMDAAIATYRAKCRFGGAPIRIARESQRATSD